MGIGGGVSGVGECGQGVFSMRLVLLCVMLVLVWAPGASRADVSFTRDVVPILLRRCTGCHGERSNLGGYRAHTYQALTKAGNSGARAILAGRPDASRLFQLITSKAEQTRMPKSDEPLPALQIDVIRRWIAEGAKYDGADPAASLKTLLGPRVHPTAPTVYRIGVPVLALSLIPGGDRIAVGGYNEITIWSSTTGALIRRIGGLPQRIQAMSFSKDSRTLLVSGGTPGEYGEISLVNVATSARTLVLEPWTDICLAAVFSPDGKRIAAGGADNTVRCYDADTGKRLWSSGVHSDWVTSVSFSGDGKFVASAGRDMTVKVNDAVTGELFTTYNGHNRQLGQFSEHAPVYAVRFAADALAAYSAGAGRWVQRWDPIKARAESGDAGDMEERFSKQSHAQHIEHGFKHEVFALTVRGGGLFAASADGIVKQFDISTLKEIRSYTAGSDWLFALDYDPATERLAAGSYSGRVTVWNAQSGAVIIAFDARPSGPVTVVRHP